MRIAICAADLDERHSLSRLAETALLRRGVLAEVALFPQAQLLLSAAARPDAPFDLALLAGARDGPLLRELCRRLPVIWVGGAEDGPAAFDSGAAYFLPTPATAEQLSKALTRCRNENKEEAI